MLHQAGPANSWPLEARVAALSSVLMADLPASAELQFAASRVLRAFFASTRVPPGEWVRVQLSDPSAAPSPVWYVRDQNGHGESRSSLNGEELVYATVTVVPDRPIARALRELVDELPSQHPAAAAGTKTLRAAESNWNEHVVHSHSASTVYRHEWPNSRDHLSMLMRDVVTLRKERAADTHLFGGVCVYGMLVEAAHRDHQSEVMLGRTIRDFYEQREPVWARLGHLVRTLLQNGMESAVLRVLEQLRIDADAALDAAKNAPSIEGWLEQTYKALPMVTAASSIAGLVRDWGETLGRARAANVHRVEDERCTIITTALINHAEDVILGTRWPNLLGHVADLLARKGEAVARDYVRSQIVARNHTHPVSSIPSILAGAQSLA